MDKILKTYEPDSLLKRGWISCLGEILQELKANRWLTYQLFKRDFLAFYRQSFIGVFWAVIMPIVSVAIFLILNRSGVFVVGNIRGPYLVYAVLGMAFWQLFSAGSIMSANALAKVGSMITQINVSKKALVISSYCQSIVSFLIQFLLALTLLVWYRASPGVGILLVPAAIIPLIIFTLGLGFVLSLLNSVARDIGNMLSMVVTFLMLLTPVVYAKPKKGLLMKITEYNPLYYMISGPRDLVTTGGISEWRGFLISAFASLAFFLLCLIAFHLAEARLAEKV
jgi:lipopolysaccharide transport system permease protein